MAVYSSGKKNVLNPAGSSYGAGAFQYGSIPALSQSYTGSSTDTAIQRPTSPASIPLTALNGLQGSIDAAKQLRANPLGDPAAAASLSQVQSALNRQQQAGIGAAKGRAAASGQGFSAGAMKDTALALQQSNAASYADASAQLAAKLAEQGRLQETELLKAQLQGELEANRNALQKYGIDADLVTNEAKLRLSKEEMQRNNLMEQARLAEQARQFGYELSEKGRQFDTELGEKARMFDEDQKLTKSQFDAKQKLAQDEFGLKKTEMDLRSKENEFQKAKELLGLTNVASQQGRADEDEVVSAYEQLGINAQPRNTQLIQMGGALIDPTTFARYDSPGMQRRSSFEKKTGRKATSTRSAWDR